MAEILGRLDNVTPRGSRYIATCPAHADRSPSLQVTPGERAILVKCWSGCRLEEICASLGINQQDLFFDALDPDPQRRRAAALQRDRQRHRREQHAEQQGTLIDALRRLTTSCSRGVTSTFHHGVTPTSSANWTPWLMRMVC